MTRPPAGNEYAELVDQVKGALPAPSPEDVETSRAHLTAWFERTAPVLHWVRLPSPIGPLLLAVGPEGLARLSFTDDTEGFLRSLDPTVRLVEGGEVVEPHRRQLKEYFAGARRQFSLATDLSDLTPFQRQVLRAIEEIPAGQVRSYGQIAQAVGKPRAARAVGQALANNPIPIVLPCHRVIASDGSLGGYAGGLARKRELLEREGVG